MFAGSLRLRSDRSLRATGSRVASTNASLSVIANSLRNLKRDIILSIQYVIHLTLVIVLSFAPGNEHHRGQQEGSLPKQEHPEGYQRHVVREKARRRRCLPRILQTTSRCHPCTSPHRSQTISLTTITCYHSYLCRWNVASMSGALVSSSTFHSPLSITALSLMPTSNAFAIFERLPRSMNFSIRSAPSFIMLAGS
jgi:hypothetical protein